MPRCRVWAAPIGFWQSGISHKNRPLVFQPIPLLRSHGPNWMILRSHTLKYIETYRETSRNMHYVT